MYLFLYIFYVFIFINPVVGWIGWFSGPDLAHGPPVDDHCCRTSEQVVISQVTNYKSGQLARRIAAE